jgi:hypothetical protein
LRAKREKEAEELKRKVEETKANAKQKEEEEKQAKKDGKPIKEPPFMDFLMNFLGAAKIHINRIHIRYEDDYFNHNRPFAFGFMIDQIELDNSETNFTFQSELSATTIDTLPEKTVNKKFEIKKIKMYWNSMSESFIPTSLWEQTRNNPDL